MNSKTCFVEHVCIPVDVLAREIILKTNFDYNFGPQMPKIRFFIFYKQNGLNGFFKVLSKIGLGGLGGILAQPIPQKCAIYMFVYKRYRFCPFWALVSKLLTAYSDKISTNYLFWFKIYTREVISKNVKNQPKFWQKLVKNFFK